MFVFPVTKSFEGHDVKCEGLKDDVLQSQLANTPIPAYINYVFFTFFYIMISFTVQEVGQTTSSYFA